MLTKTYTQDYLISTIKVQDALTAATVLDRSYAFGDSINLTGITDNYLPSRSESYAFNTVWRKEQCRWRRSSAIGMRTT